MKHAIRASMAAVAADRPSRRAFSLGAGSLALLAAAGRPRGARGAVSASGHALAMHGEPALAEGFSRFTYVDPQARRGGRLVYGAQGTFDSLNPLIVKGNAPDVVPRFVLQRLMMRSLDEPFTLYGLLARRVELAPDHSRVTFHLDGNACFSDGTPLTAHDVAFSFDLLKNHGRPYFRAVAAEVSSATVADARTIAFDLSRSANPETPLNIALMPILPRHATDAASFADTTLKPQLGSGPYVVAEVRAGTNITLTRNPNYWARDLPQMTGLHNPDELRVDFYRDANSLFEAFKAGLIDIRLEDEPGRWMRGYSFPAMRAGKVIRETIPIRLPAGMNGFAFNTRRDLFADRRVRQALSMMFDFEWVNANLFFGAYRRTAGFFDESDLSSIGRPASARELALLSPYRDDIPSEVLDGQWRPPVTDGSGRDRRLERGALALLEQAEWVSDSGRIAFRQTGRALAFEIMATSQFQERLALNYASSLARIGVAARVRRVDEVQFWRRMQHFDFDMVQFNWAGSPSPGNELPNRWSSAAADREGSLNYPAVRSKAVDAMVEAALTAASLADFTDAVRALDRALIAGSYIVPLYHAPDIWLARRSTARHPAYIPLFGFSLETVWNDV
jgi:peptide/nickel transport system substrate-binding protein